MSPTPRINARGTALLLVLVFLVLLLQVLSINSAGRESASGWFTPHCDGASFYLSNVDGLPSGQKLNLNMRHYAFSWWNYSPREIWEKVYAERCPSIGKCEEATHARIWLEKGDAKDKRVSGKYDVDFGGQHFEGQFLAKYRKEKTDYICE